MPEEACRQAHLHAGCAVSAGRSIRAGVTLGEEGEKLSLDPGMEQDMPKLPFQSQNQRQKMCWPLPEAELGCRALRLQDQRWPAMPLGLHCDDPQPSTDSGTIPLCPLPAHRGAAYLTPRFASGTRQTGGTHGAGGATVARRAGCSLFPRFALKEGKIKDNRREWEIPAQPFTRHSPLFKAARLLCPNKHRLLPGPDATGTRQLPVALQNPKPHPGLGSLGCSSCT